MLLDPDRWSLLPWVGLLALAAAAAARQRALVLVVGVTAGASAPEELVDAVIAVLAPATGVERVRVTDEDEYFPPPPELRELVPALDTIAAFAFGGDPRAARALGGRFAGDRSSDAAEMLASLDD